MSWSDDKELSSGANIISWNSLSPKKKKTFPLPRHLFIINTYFLNLHVYICSLFIFIITNKFRICDGNFLLCTTYIFLSLSLSSWSLIYFNALHFIDCFLCIWKFKLNDNLKFYFSMYYCFLSLSLSRSLSLSHFYFSIILIVDLFQYFAFYRLLYLYMKIWVERSFCN